MFSVLCLSLTCWDLALVFIGINLPKCELFRQNDTSIFPMKSCHLPNMDILGMTTCIVQISLLASEVKPESCCPN